MVDADVFAGLTLEYLPLHSLAPNVIITAGPTQILSNFGLGLHLIHVGTSVEPRWDVRVLSPCCYEIYGVSLDRSNPAPMCRGCGVRARWPVAGLDFQNIAVADNLQAIIERRIDPLRAAILAPHLLEYLRSFVSLPPQPTFEARPLRELIPPEASA